jgi:hypothetical protein
MSGTNAAIETDPVVATGQEDPIQEIDTRAGVLSDDPNAGGVTAEPEEELTDAEIEELGGQFADPKQTHAFGRMNQKMKAERDEKLATQAELQTAKQEVELLRQQQKEYLDRLVATNRIPDQPQTPVTPEADPLDLVLQTEYAVDDEGQAMRVIVAEMRKLREENRTLREDVKGVTQYRQQTEAERMDVEFQTALTTLGAKTGLVVSPDKMKALADKTALIIKGQLAMNEKVNVSEATEMAFTFMQNNNLLANAAQGGYTAGITQNKRDITATRTPGGVGKTEPDYSTMSAHEVALLSAKEALAKVEKPFLE